ncbi:MAG: hypothetical protein IPN94_23840 [Sphingobacteriales bacterium]|nr:hypothetical protein [Sphingobacteriales bacterium]
MMNYDFSPHRHITTSPLHHIATSPLHHFATSPHLTQSVHTTIRAYFA